MALPADFDKDKWLDPLAFQGLIGRVFASPSVKYEDLFRPCGFAKSKAELSVWALAELDKEVHNELYRYITNQGKL